MILDIFEFAIMRRAFIVGALLAVIVPCIGVIVVLKRLSMIGDALSHTALAGVAAGLLMSINPTIGAMAACIISALGIELIRKRMPRYAELSIAIIMSVGIGLAGVLSDFVKGAANFNSFLFGSIVAISNTELFLVIGVSAAVFLMFILFYKELFFVAFDEKAARLAGVPVRSVNFLFTVLTAVTVSVASRTVGALIVSSLMVIPVACAMQFAKSYRQTVLFAIGFALFFTISGLFASYYVELRPGATIVLIGAATLVLSLVLKAILGRRA